MSYHFVSYRIVSHHITSHQSNHNNNHIISHIIYHIISYHISCHIISHHIIFHIPHPTPHPTVPYRTVPYRTVPYHTISYHTIDLLCPNISARSRDIEPPMLLWMHCILPSLFLSMTLSSHTEIDSHSIAMLKLSGYPRYKIKCNLPR